jgi:cytidyltransferase-like protein
MSARKAAVAGSFDDVRSGHVRFLHEASRLGLVHVVLRSDAAIRALEGHDPKFPGEERRYLIEAVRYVDRVSLAAGDGEADILREIDEVAPDIFVADAGSANAAEKAWCGSRGIEYRVLGEKDLGGFPAEAQGPEEGPPAGKKVIVTGCFDWFHSGHVAFFEEVSACGDLYVGIGSDENVRQMKGRGHPMFPQEERLYLVQSVRHVRKAFVSTGRGWLDAEPEIAIIKPDIYAVNEDGDVPEKREFCASRGIEYRVFKRVPRRGLPRRESTRLRGF